MDNFPTSRSYRFFLNLDPAKPPPVRELCFHWKYLAEDNLGSEDWGAVLKNIVAVNIGMDKIDRQIFASAIRHKKDGLPAYRKAHEAIYYAPNPSDILAGMQFFARHDNGIEISFFEECHLKLRSHLLYMPAKDLASALYPFVKICHLPDENFWNDLEDSWCHKFSAASVMDVTDFYNRAARLAMKMKTETIALFDDFLRNNAATLSSSKRDRLFWIAAMVDSVHGRTVLADTVPDLVKEYGMAGAAWQNTVCARFDIPLKPLKVIGSDSPSDSELKLKAIFASAATLKPEKDHRLPYIASPVDMRFDFEGTDIIIEMDGLTHFNFDFNGGRRYNGQTILNSSIKTKVVDQARLLHIDEISFNYIFYRCATQEQDRIAKAVLEKASSHEVGNYRVDISQKGIFFAPM